MTEASNNKRIAKNSIYLYLRMFFSMAISIYTSRVILSSLGITDYGINNLVAGLSGMFSMVMGPIASASARFVTVALGKKDHKELIRTFATSKLIHIMFAGVMLLLLETVGNWLLFNKLVIPQERLMAAFWVFQFSIFSLCLGFITIPYSGLIVAHERMGAFAYISIYESVMRLLIAIAISVASCDHLIFYGFLGLCVQISIQILYSWYSHRHFEESRHRLQLDRKMFKSILIYSAWTLNGSLAVIGCSQGLNILLNLFFGPTVNAARAIAVTVQGHCIKFVNSFQSAFSPQIMKSYSAGELEYMHKLLINSSKYSFYIMLLVTVPITMNVEYILNLWLGEYPEHCIEFVRITLMIGLVGTFRMPIINSIHATGDIKRFQMIEATVLLLVVPVSYIALKSGITSPEIVFIISLGIEFITQIIRVFLVMPKIHMKVSAYFKKIFLPAGISFIPIAVLIAFYRSEVNFSSFFVSLVFAEIVIVSSVWTLGVSKHERIVIGEKMKEIVNKKIYKYRH